MSIKMKRQRYKKGFITPKLFLNAKAQRKRKGRNAVNIAVSDICAC